MSKAVVLASGGMERWLDDAAAQPDLWSSMRP